MSVQRIFLLPALAVLLGVFASSAAPAMATVGWTAWSVAAPTHFAPNDVTECESAEAKCDLYEVVVLNTGTSASTGTVTVADTLPQGLTTVGKGGRPYEVRSELGPHEEEWSCEAPAAVKTTVTCSLSSAVAAGAYAPVIRIPVMAPSEAMLKEAQKEPGKGRAILTNKATVEGGETLTTPSASTSDENEVSTLTPSFGITDFGFEALSAEGGRSGDAGAHLSTALTRIGFPDIFKPPSRAFPGPVRPVEQPKNVVVELPAGFVGDPLATPRCPQYDPKVEREINGLGSGEFEAVCAHEKSEVGALAFDGEMGGVRTTGEPAGGTQKVVSPVYNMTPEDGYPAELGFVYEGNPISLYASVVHNSSGYRLRVAAPSLTTTVGLLGVQTAFFGNAAERDGLSAHTAFLTNPADCAEGPLEAKVEADSWEHPNTWVAKTAVAYPQLEDCNLLQFEPKLEMAPSPVGEEGTSRADEPSAYNVNLEVPQKTLFEETATPDLDEAKVTLPAGVSVSPSAADGLQGCAATGPEGIDIPSGNHVPDEAGEGETIGPDGLSHLTAGHCPQASTLGTVEITTPVLETPLKGHVYLAQPKCGGAGQPACTEASATNGELYGLYIEAEGSGVVIKLPGTVSANPSTGQLTGMFKENPQLPFSELKLHFHGGPRAPIANPQTCGTFTTTSTLTSWGGQETSSSSPFNVDWDGHGGACPATLPFNPGFSAGTTNPVADTYSPFVLSFSRQDREQDLSGISVTLPPGLLGKITGVPLCEEAQANAGTCGPESQIGSASVLTGPGTNPLYVSGGRVYLTTGYKGGSYGLSIVVPAVAGPFNLGNVVVRASIHIDPNTSQVTVTSDPLPQSRDGVPFRLRTVITEINRPGFTFNPTNCAQQQVTATITGAQGAKANVASPFAVAGCKTLPFHPSFTASTSGKTSKADGASFVVNVSQKPGEANIHKVDLQLPLALPARLTTLQKACTQAQFNTNPAGCPEGSFIGAATAVTPVLPVPLTGPAILVSHGGAAFPDVEFVLQGDGVQIVLDGATDIKKGITYSKFETVPDAPITSFVTTLPEGPHSALAANGNLCEQTATVSVKKRVTVRVHGRKRRVTRTVKQTVPAPLLAPTTITGQNGAQISQSTRISVTGCPKGKPKTARKAKAKKKGGKRK